MADEGTWREKLNYQATRSCTAAAGIPASSSLLQNPMLVYHLYDQDFRNSSPEIGMSSYLSAGDWLLARLIDSAESGGSARRDDEARLSHAASNSSPLDRERNVCRVGSGITRGNEVVSLCRAVLPGTVNLAAHRTRRNHYTGAQYIAANIAQHALLSWAPHGLTHAHLDGTYRVYRGLVDDFGVSLELRGWRLRGFATGTGGSVRWNVIDCKSCL